MEVVVCWIVVPRSLVVIYRQFRVPCYLHL